MLDSSMYGTLLNGIRVEIIKFLDFNKKDKSKNVYVYPRLKVSLMMRGNPAVEARRPNAGRRQGKPKELVVSINEFVEGSISSRK